MIDHFPSPDQRLPANETTEEGTKKILEGIQTEIAYLLAGMPASGPAELLGRINMLPPELKNTIDPALVATLEEAAAKYAQQPENTQGAHW